MSDVGSVPTDVRPPDPATGWRDTAVIPLAGETGTVVFHDWMPMPFEARLVRGIHGVLRVVSAAEVLGHDVNSRDSIVVGGVTSRFVVLGCQVRAVWLGTGPDNAEMTAVP